MLRRVISSINFFAHVQLVRKIRINKRIVFRKTIEVLIIFSAKSVRKEDLEFSSSFPSDHWSSSTDSKNSSLSLKSTIHLFFFCFFFPSSPSCQMWVHLDGNMHLVIIILDRKCVREEIRKNV